MNTQDFSRCKALNNVPNKKLLEKINSIENNPEDSVSTKSLKINVVNRYAESNIPVEYWSLKMEKDFIGDPNLLIKYNEYIKDIKSSYINGTSICFAGSHGRGKTLVTTNILKHACHKGYNCLYTTLSDMVNVLTQAVGEDRYLARKELLMVDFLAIDEFDSRFMPSENAADLYARNLENIFRSRIQNKLPTIMCTNSPNIIESFNGALKASLESLTKGYLEIFPVFGPDYRKKNI